MASNKKPRKAYRPRKVLVDPVSYVLTGMKPLTWAKDELVTLRITNHGAFAALTQGRATRQDFELMVAALNMTEALMLQRLGDEYSNDMRAGQDALEAIAGRSVSLGGRFVVKAEEMKALNEAMVVHDAQLDVCTIAQLERAIDTVQQTIRQGRVKRIGGQA